MPSSRQSGSRRKAKMQSVLSAREGFVYLAKEFGLASVGKSKLLDSVVA